MDRVQLFQRILRFQRGLSLLKSKWDSLRVKKPTAVNASGSVEFGLSFGLTR